MELTLRGYKIIVRKQRRQRGRTRGFEPKQPIRTVRAAQLRRDAQTRHLSARGSRYTAPSR